MTRSRTMLLVASMITATHAQTRAFSLNSSKAFWITSTDDSRSPNEYLSYDSWESNCWQDDDYSIEHCVRSHVIDGRMPTSAIWWVIPEEGTKNPQWVHIVAGRDSSWGGSMLGPFDWSGNIYPKPFWWEDADFARREMVWARYKIEATTVDGEELVFIITGPESGKADEMLFLNRNIGDWLDTWGIDRSDRRAMWKLVPVPCSDSEYASSCELPDFEAAWDKWKRGNWIGWAIAGGVIGFCCLCGVFGKKKGGTSVAQRTWSRRSERRDQRSGGASSAGADSYEMGVVAATPVATVATATAVPIVTATAVPVVALTAV